MAEKYLHLTFSIIEAQRSYSFGVNMDERHDRAFNEHFHLTLTAQLLSEHRLKGEDFTIYVLADDYFDNAAKMPFRNGPYAIGNITMRKNNMTAYASIPTRQMAAIWNAVSGDGLRILSLTIQNLGRGRLNVEGISFRDTIDPDDI